MQRYILAALVALSAFPAAAQDGNGLTFGGDVKLEYVNANSDLWALDGDVGLSWRSGGLLGFDAALDTTFLHNNGNDDDLTNVWAALVLSTGVGEFAVGAPRPLLETMAVMPKFSSSRVLDLETTIFRGPITPVASAQDNGLTPGITYQKEAGSLTFGAGYHHLNDLDADTFEGIMRYQAGAVSLFVSGEYGRTPGPNTTILQIGGMYDADRFDLGAALSRFDSSLSANSLRLYGSFDVMSSLTLRGDALLVQDANDIYSLSATYGMQNGLYVEGGGTKIVGQDEVYDLGVGFKF